MKRLSFLLSAAFLIASAHAQMQHPKLYSLLDVNWKLSFNEARGTIQGDVINTVRPLSNTKSIAFDCGKLDVSAVWVNDAPATFLNDGKILTVNLVSASGPESTLKIRVVYSGHPQAGVYFVPAKRASPATTSMVYTQGEMIDTRYWLPTYDWPDNKATFECQITVPKGYYALSNGKLLEVKEDGDNAVYHWKLDQPQSTYLISFVAGKYDEGVDRGGAVPTTFYVPQGLLPWGEASFGGTSKLVDFYGKLTGFPYPYPKFAQAAVADYMFGGMENITAVTQTINTLHPPEVGLMRDSTGLVAHELAHQWFGDTITCADWQHIWLNEGFATFLPHFVTRDKDGQAAYDIQRKNTFNDGWGGQNNSHRPVVSDRYKEPIDLFDGVVYAGGASRMFMLMHDLGEETFWKGIKAYLEQYKYQNATTEQFFEVMSRVSGHDLDAFRQQWFYNAEVPSLHVSRDGSNLLVTESAKDFQFDLDVWVLDGTTWAKRKMTVKTGDNRLDLGALSGKPVIVDPEVNLMVQIAYEMGYSADQWSQLYLNTPNAGERSRLLDAMYGSLDPGLKATLIANESVPELRRRMVSEYGIGGLTIAEAMVKSADPRDRVAGYQALAKQNGNAEAEKALRDASDNEPNIEARLEATRAVVQLTGDPKVVEAAYKLDHYSDGFRRFALGWWADNDKVRARKEALAIMDRPHSEDLRVDAIRILGRLKDVPGDTPAYEALVKVVQEPSFGARVAAMGALAEYGDPRAINVLRPITSNSMHFVRRAAQRAIEILSGQ